MRYKLYAPKAIDCVINLPASKSISNRALVINALSGSKEVPENLSDCDDTDVMVTALRDMPYEINIKAAGTAMRFTSALLSVTEGEEHVITGTDRMKHRPIEVLVNALRNLGADIEYAGEEGFPPLKIRGKKLAGGLLEIPGNVSSQYISALLMIGPKLTNGLTLHLTGDIISRPYIEMTICTMQEFGADVEWTDASTIRVKAGGYKERPFFIENDWSASSYWYEMAALSEDCDLMLEGLKPDPLQGDSVVAELYQSFGVQTSFEPKGVRLTKAVAASLDKPLELDFSMKPDLFPAVFVTCVALHYPAVFRGIQNLTLKESDRVDSIITELSKVYSFDCTINNDEIILGSSLLMNHNKLNNVIVFRTFDDHRVAMALSGLSLVLGPVSVDHPEVVSKSYPTFWKERMHIYNFII